MSDPVRPIDPLADELEWWVGVKGFGYRTATTVSLGVKDLTALVALLKIHSPIKETTQ